MDAQTEDLIRILRGGHASSCSDLAVDTDTTVPTAAPATGPPPGLTEGAQRLWEEGGLALTMAINLGAEFLGSAERAGFTRMLTPDNGPQLSSAEKGARAEVKVFEALQGSYHAIVDTSGTSRAGDLSLDTVNGLVLVEVKDYISTVPKREVEKFKRDVNATNAAAGVLISLSSPIVSLKKGGRISVRVESTDTSMVPLVYLSSDDPDLIRAAVDIAVMLAGVYPRACMGLHSTDAMLSYVLSLEDLIDRYDEVRTELGDLQGTFTTFSEQGQGTPQRDYHCSKEPCENPAQSDRHTAPDRQEKSAGLGRL